MHYPDDFDTIRRALWRTARALYAIAYPGADLDDADDHMRANYAADAHDLLTAMPHLMNHDESQAWRRIHTGPPGTPGVGTPGARTPEQTITVVFDIAAATRRDAATALALALAPDTLRDLINRSTGPHLAQLESWWFPEPDLKAVDGNDNAALILTSAGETPC